MERPIEVAGCEEGGNLGYACGCKGTCSQHPLVEMSNHVVGFQLVISVELSINSPVAKANITDS